MARVLRFLMALWRLIRAVKAATPSDLHEHVAGTDAAPSAPNLHPVRMKPKSKASDEGKDWLRRPGETAQDWWERTTKTR